MTDTYSFDELENFDLWDAVDRIKAKIEQDTRNDDKKTQALMISFEISQIINELLDFSLEFSGRIVLHK